MRNSLKDNLGAFLRGMASVLDLTGSMSRRRLDHILRRTDAEALASDWDAVGADIRHALQRDKEWYHTP